MKAGGMASGEKRKPLSVMIALGAPKRHPDSESPEEDKGETDEDEADEEGGDEMEACQDVMDAFRTRDVKALNVALHRWMQLAGYERAGD